MQPGLGDHPTHDGSAPQTPRPRTGKRSVRRHATYATPALYPPMPTHCRTQLRACVPPPVP
ncbi:putative Delta-aminolevulinic acid dehydratase [Streptomyces afghaniensis 772]|uniref:Putative Delta-aminolevulinic acid dehydratase n=1 Tax=Streptomyces afghaniensis 772 TaxID=1283301 RepID=S4MM01_9ACTN|nr:putative Delta-aminolevulinic acid dehydratase [Streptomyces afghaniensis 772]